MTDLATRPGAGESGPDDTPTAVVAESSPTDGAGEAYVWAAAGPAPRKRLRWLWFAIPAAVIGLGLGAASLVVIAPGTTVAGVPVGGLTPGAAADAINASLASTTVVLTGAGEDVVVTGADLGATLDATALADAAFAAHPGWNVTSWFAPALDADITFDQTSTAAALQDAAPALYVAPTDAVIAYDDATQTYVTTPAVPGEGIDATAVEATFADAFEAGSSSAAYDTSIVPIPAVVTTETADATAATLNAMLDTAGFYVGEERTVPIDRATLAAWLTVTPTATGTFAISASANGIQGVVDGLQAAVDRPAVDATVIVNEAGQTLSDITAGVTGRTLDSTAGIANAYADQLATGNAVYTLPVTETAFATTTLARLLEVDLSEQRLYLKENGVVVDSWAISSGAANTPTFTGHYTIGYKTTVQTMNGYNRDAAGNITGTYSTPNVKWPMYFNGGQAFHGVYWHNNFGTPMSHGCIGMPEWRAQQIYDWSPKGTDVWIHN